MKQSPRRATLTFLLAAGWCAAAAAAGSPAVLVEIDDLAPGDFEVAGFELERRQEVAIKARCLTFRKSSHKSYEIAGGWILDSESREVVWSSAGAESKGRDREIREVDAKVSLDAGAYEVYYATYPQKHPTGDHPGWWESAARSVARMFGWDDEADVEHAIGKLGLVIRADGRKLDGQAVKRSRARLREQALVALAAEDDGFAENRGFALERPMELVVYAVGELEDDGAYDYGWIVDAANREKVWTFTYEGSKGAGGALKNRTIHDTLKLPAGRYAAYFVTDGSHSPEHWNAMPPHDPAFWGLTVWLKDPDQRQFAKAYDYSHLPGDEQVIAELIRMRGRDLRTQGFTLKRPMTVRVYALGESTKSGMVDYGWIMNARTRERVWSMDIGQTEPAGGAWKNRLADVDLRLEPGSYIVAFVTDGSHAYRDWNAAPPPDPERWGISVFGGEGFDREAVEAYREDDDPGVLARIAQVRSDSHRRREFSLDRTTRVSVYALGEGTHGRMHDYAWLEDSAGKVVWEMTYPATGGAGGASKNRLFQGTLELAPGDYVLHYKSDDSHAYRDWNASPPHDPEGWGAQIARLD